MGKPNLVPIPRVGDAGGINRAIRKLASLALGPDSTPTFAEMTITSMTVSGLTASRLLATDADNLLVSSDLDAWVAGTENEIDVAQNGGGVTLSLAAGSAGTLDHDDLINTHNLTTDIDHDQLTNVHQDVNTDASPTFAGLIPAADDTHDIGLAEEDEPDFTLRISQTLENSTEAVSNVQWAGTSFTPATGFNLAKVDFWMLRDTGGTGNVTLHLTATAGGLPTEEEFASVTIDGTTISDDTWGWVTFELETPYTLTQDVVYAVYVSATTAKFNIRYQFSNEYADGQFQLTSDSGGTWYDLGDRDGTFRIYSVGEREYTYTRWQDLYLSGLLHDGTVSLSIANAKAAYVHSLLTSGNPHSVTPTELSLVIGTNVQAHGNVLDDLNTVGQVGADSEFLVGTGIGTFAWENALTARTSLGVGTGDTPTFAGGLFTGSVTIFNSNPILTFKDSDSTGDDARGVIEWRDSNNIKLGYFGNSSGGNDELLWKNESSGGHIQVQTIGGGEFQIYANTVLNGNSITGIGTLASGNHTITGTLDINPSANSSIVVRENSFGEGALIIAELQGTTTGGLGTGFSMKDALLVRGSGATALLVFSNTDFTGTANIKYTTATDILSFEEAASYAFDAGLTVDTTTLVVDAVNHRVGIGTASPQGLLHVSGGDIILDNNTALRFEDSGGTARDMFTLTNSNIAFIGPNSGATHLRLRAGGGVAATFIAATNNFGLSELSPETLLEMTSTVPYLTLHNSTEENSDGGRESRINFKGEQSDTTETTLVRIEVSHDGTGDDEKGKLVISVNDGDDGDTPTEMLRISANGSTTQSSIAQTISGSKTLVDNTATGFVDIAISPDELIGGHILYCIYVKGDNDELQSHSGTANFSAINKLETVTSDIEEAYLPAREVEVVSAGTLTDDFTITNTNGDPGKITINCDANSNLDNPVLILYYTIIMHSLNTITTL